MAETEGPPRSRGGALDSGLFWRSASETLFSARMSEQGSDQTLELGQVQLRLVRVGSCATGQKAMRGAVWVARTASSRAVVAHRRSVLMGAPPFEFSRCG